MRSLICFEDEHLLVVCKPSGVNSHAPAPFAGEGLYDWLRHREPRWAELGILHRLDKDTSGLMLFSKTTRASRSLALQFAEDQVTKRYLLLTDRPVTREEWTMTSTLVRAGNRFFSRPLSPGKPVAVTRFRVRQRLSGTTLIEAEPRTGRTHQIRVHAAADCPILGDPTYGGTPAARLCLHAWQLELSHPVTGARLAFTAPADFEDDVRLALRRGLIDEQETNVYRLIHGASDGWPGWYLDRLGGHLLSQSERPLAENQWAFLASQRANLPQLGLYHKSLVRRPAGADAGLTSPQPLQGQPVPAAFLVRENNLQFEVSFQEGCSVGLFLDQRDNRRRLLTGHVGAGFPLFERAPVQTGLLNTFAYTCAFSTCAARAGTPTVNIDLSQKYLDWGKRNFLHNGLNPDTHEFLCGDVFQWLRRLERHGRKFDLIILDPPTFSRSKASGTFSASKDYGRLVGSSLGLLQPRGVLFCSSNTASLDPARFVQTVTAAIRAGGRSILQQLYVPQPPDFPISRDEPAYLKTLWLRVG